MSCALGLWRRRRRAWHACLCRRSQPLMCDMLWRQCAGPSSSCPPARMQCLRYSTSLATSSNFNQVTSRLSLARLVLRHHGRRIMGCSMAVPHHADVDPDYEYYHSTARVVPFPEGVELLPSEREQHELGVIGGPNSSTYGEITSQGFEALAQRLRLGPDDNFVDLGSGLGRCTMQAASRVGVRHACGIEYVGSRHRAAVAALTLSSRAMSSRVTYLQGDCADASFWHGDDAPLAGATVLYVSSLLFSTKLMARLAKRISEHCSPGDGVHADSSGLASSVGLTANSSMNSPCASSSMDAEPAHRMRFTRGGSCARLRAVATLKRWKRGALAGSGFREEWPPQPCEMTWSAAQPVYIYRRVATTRTASLQ